MFGSPNRGMGKTEMSNAFFVSLFSMDDGTRQISVH